VTQPKSIEWEGDDRYQIVFTTRCGGTSVGPCESLNLGLLTDDDPASVFHNRQLACSDAGADATSASMSHQVHGPRVGRAEPTGIDAPADHPRRDGCWSDVPGQAMLVLTADCLPIALYRSEGTPAAAVIHAGWRGLLAGVIEAGVRELASNNPCAAVGPAIGPCCYEVGESVARPFIERYGANVVDGSRLNLWEAAEWTLRAAGCTRVDRINRCTSCEPDTFFSHRRDHGITGRQGVIAFVR